MGFGANRYTHYLFYFFRVERNYLRVPVIIVMLRYF